MAQPAKISKVVYKDAWQDIEDYDKVMLITWNPKPKFYDYSIYGPNDFNMQWRTMMELLIQAYRACCRFAFVPEVSDEGKLHMHGWYVVSDRVKYNKSFLPSLYRSGFIKKSRAKSHEFKTFKYHIKELYETHQYLNEFDGTTMVITHENVMLLKHNHALYLSLMAKKYSDLKKIKVLKKDITKMFENY